MTMPGMTNAQKAAHYLGQFEYWADQVAGHMQRSQQVGEAEARARGDQPAMAEYYAEADMTKNPWAMLAKAKRDAMLNRANLYATLAVLDRLR